MDMPIEVAIEILNRHTACRNKAICEMNCDDCANNVTNQDVNEALEVAKLALYRLQTQQEALKKL